MDDLMEISLSLKEELRKRSTLPESSFELWFGDFVLTSLTEDKAIFSTPTVVRKNILKNRHLPSIKECFEYIMGFPYEIEIFSLEEKRKLEEERPVSLFSARDEEEEKGEKEEHKAHRSILDDYTFDNFVEGESNKFAKSCCYAVANEPGSANNPLFIYGHSGLGKTHLLYAIINYIKEHQPSLNIVYTKCETFVNELVNAIKEQTTDKFKEKYRAADVLLIDDIQFLAKKEQTQEEFFHTFTVLYEAEKQIILTSDRPPKDINPLMDRLRTRFEWGLLADVQPPSLELRIAIIKKKCEDMKLEIPSHLVDYIAERLNKNVRQIEGVLKKLYAINSFSAAEITKQSIDDIISIVDPGNIPTDILVEKIMNTVSRHYGVTVEEIRSKKKTERIANARHVIAYIIKELTDLSYGDTGKFINREHSTVMSSVSKVNEYIRTKNNFEAELAGIMKEIKGD